MNQCRLSLGIFLLELPLKEKWIFRILLTCIYDIFRDGFSLQRMMRVCSIKVPISFVPQILWYPIKGVCTLILEGLRVFKMILIDWGWLQRILPTK